MVHVPCVSMNVRVARKASRSTWFSTRTGQKISLCCIIALGGGTAAFNILPHTLLLDKYRELFQLYRKSTPVRVSSKIKKQFDAVLDDLKLPDEIRFHLKPFMVIGFDIFRAGTTLATSGALVGIPANFEYEDIKDIDQSALLVQGRHVDWSKPDGQNLLSAILLSDDAKKFAIGREIVRCQTIEPILNTLYPITCATIAYVIRHQISRITYGVSLPLLYRIMLYALAGLFSFGNWIVMKDVTTVHYDTKCDKAMSELGKDYIKGGQEFYEKILQRNVALRNLMGKEGVKLYSAIGNDEFFIRHKRMPIVHRKLYFDQQMESLD